MIKRIFSVLVVLIAVATVSFAGLFTFPVQDSGPAAINGNIHNFTNCDPASNWHFAVIEELSGKTLSAGNVNSFGYFAGTWTWDDTHTLYGLEVSRTRPSPKTVRLAHQTPLPTTYYWSVQASCNDPEW